MNMTNHPETTNSSPQEEFGPIVTSIIISPDAQIVLASDEFLMPHEAA